MCLIERIATNGWAVGAVRIIQLNFNRMTADKILKKYEDDNEYHFHTVDRKWIIAAMEEYAALRQKPVSGSVCTCLNAQTEKYSQVPVYCHNCKAYVQTDR